MSTATERAVLSLLAQVVSKLDDAVTALEGIEHSLGQFDRALQERESDGSQPVSAWLRELMDGDEVDDLDLDD